jgi:hypothetical protein
MHNLITPGTLYILWEAVSYLIKDRDHEVDRENLTSAIYNLLYIISSKNLINSSLDWSIDAGLLCANGAKIALSTRVESEYFLDSRKEFFLNLLREYILAQKPYWVAFFSDDIETLSLLIPQPWLDLLNSADLLDFDKPETSKWWSLIISRFESFEKDNSKLVGNIGEKLTVDFELKRLRGENFNITHSSVIWASKFSDHFGYDISSTAGSLIKANPDQRIFIEVKASQSSYSPMFRFFLSRNEWETALKNPDTYFFYLWNDIDLENQKQPSTPCVLLARQIIDMIPFEKSDFCKWMELQIVLDLTKIQHQVLV